MLRRVRAHPRARHARCCSSPTTWAPCSASATARCCSSAGASSRSATRSGSATATSSSTSTEATRERADGERRGARRRAGSATVAPRSSRPGSRTSTARRSAFCTAGGRARSCARVRFNEAVDDPIFGFVLQNSRRDTGVRPPTSDRRAGDRALRAGRGDRVPRRVRLACSARTATAPRRRWRAAARRHGLDRPARAVHVGHGHRARRDTDGIRRPPPRDRVWSARRPRRAATPRSPGERRGQCRLPPRSPIKGPTALRRRPAPALAPHPHARGHRLQAALLRLRARLRVAAACGRCCCSASSTWSSRRSCGCGNKVELYPVALLLGVVLYSFFGEATGGALTQHGRPREPDPQDRVPAPGRANGERAHRAVQPRAEPGRRPRLPAGLGRRGAVDLARATAHPRGPDGAGHGAGRCC